MSDSASELAARIALTLKERRYSLQISQSTLAAQVGTSKSQLNRWENLTVTPTGAMMIRWARALDMRLIVVPIDSRERRMARFVETIKNLPRRKSNRAGWRRTDRIASAQ